MVDRSEETRPMVYLLVRGCAGGRADNIFWSGAEHRGRDISVQGVHSVTQLTFVRLDTWSFSTPIYIYRLITCPKEATA